MTPFLRRSRITKAIVDRAQAGIDFAAAEQRLASVRVGVSVDRVQGLAPAGQAAVLTAIATSMRCFGHAVLVVDGEAPLAKGLPLGQTLASSAATLGAEIATHCPHDVTHNIVIGDAEVASGSTAMRCWWDRWRAGIVPSWDDTAIGGSLNPLAGAFAGALAVRQIFAAVVAGKLSLDVPRITSLWEPWAGPDDTSNGPDVASVPTRLWFVGLGHLGQGVLWNLGLLPVAGQLAVLQDDQTAGPENAATGIITTETDVSHKKTRIAARWLDALGWPTALIERRHYGDLPRHQGDPILVVTSLDEPTARMKIAAADFNYMVDVGVGHGPVDFESIQLRILPKGTDPKPFWSAAGPAKNVEAMLTQDAYRFHTADFGECGSFGLADASVAVPFVGAAAGAVLMAQLIRFASMLPTPQIMQMDLGCPELVMTGRFNDSPSLSSGSVEMRFG